MIKGINKRIIEINDTNNNYIEKAILIISPGADSTEKEQEKITNEVHDYFSNLMKQGGGDIYPPQKKKGKYKTFIFALALALLLSGGACTALIMNL